MENVQYKDYKSMTDFLNTIKLKAEGLKNMDGKMDDDEIVITILRKFPRSLSYIRGSSDST